LKARIFKPAEFSETSNSVRIILKNALDSENSDLLLTFSQLRDFSNYNRPEAVACLIKAVLIYTGLIQLSSVDTLHDQLNNKLSGSLELHSWTNLPHGSGLGTSSILIGCILTAVWKLMKIKVSDKSLIYAVLQVEQMMTTGKTLVQTSEFSLIRFSFLFERWRVARPGWRPLAGLQVHNMQEPATNTTRLRTCQNRE
jgi:hypothetical protein